MVDNIFEIENNFLLTRPDSLLDRTQLGRLCADRLDTPPQTVRAVVVTLMIGDQPGD